MSGAERQLQFVVHPVPGLMLQHLEHPCRAAPAPTHAPCPSALLVHGAAALALAPPRFLSCFWHDNRSWDEDMEEKDGVEERKQAW